MYGVIFADRIYLIALWSPNCLKMKAHFFKLRKPFELFPHPYTIGNLFGPWRKNADNHFILKLQSIPEEKYVEYYNYHLNHSLKDNTATKEVFFKEIWLLIETRIGYFQNRNPYGSTHEQDINTLNRLRAFQKFLISIDKWNLRPLANVITEKDRIIQELTAKNEQLKMQLDELTKYEVKQKISIENGYLATMVDLVQQLRTLQLPSGRLLVTSDHKTVYAKIISKYFSHGEKNIPIETARNYFVEVKEDIPIKGTSVYTDQQIFKIVPAK